MKRSRSSGRLAWVALMAATCGAGCNSRMFRASPLWTPPDKEAKAPDPDRFNAWPLYYKNYDQVSALYFFVKTKDSLSVRPLFDWRKKEGTLDILFPLGRIRTKGGNSWLFPAMWGGNQEEGHRHVFPLYWSAWSKNRSIRTIFPLFWDFKSRGSRWGTLFPLAFWTKSWAASLLPLAFWNKKDGGFLSLAPPMYLGKEYRWFLWPLLTWKKTDADRWKFASFPFYNWDNDDYSYVMWPLYHRWKTDHGHGNLLPIPMVYWERSPEYSRFFALPLLSYRERIGDRSTIISPFWLGWGDKQTERRVVPPLLSYYEKDKASGATTLVNPLFGFRKDKEASWGYVLPAALGWHRDRDSSTWVSPLYAGWKNSAADTDVRIVPPLLTYWRRSGDVRDWFSPIYAGYTSPGASKHVVPPLLSYYHRNSSGTLLATPLFGAKRGKNESWSYVLPALSFYGRRGNEKSWFTPLYAGYKTPDVDMRAVLPLLSVYRKDASGTMLANPLFGAKRGKNESWSYALPALSFYSRQGADKTWFSPLYAGHSTPEASTHVIPPLLTYFARDSAGSLLATPLFGAGSGQDYRWNYALPLLSFYRRWGKEKTWFSPLYAGRTEPGSDLRVIPPLLSYWHRTDEETHWLTPLGGGRHSAEETSVTLLPGIFYHRKGERRTLTSLLAIAKWSPEKSRVAIPPLLTVWSRDADARWWFSPLSAGYSDKNEAWSCILPLAALYRRTGDVGRWYSPVVWGKTSPEQSWLNVFGILYHQVNDHVNDEKDVFALMGLAGHHRSKERRRTWVMPFYGYSWDKLRPARYLGGLGRELDRRSHSAFFMLYRDTRATRVVRDPSVEVPAALRSEKTGDLDQARVDALEEGSVAHQEWLKYLDLAERKVEYHYNRFLPFYGYERTGDRETKFHVLFFLYNFHRKRGFAAADGAASERVETRILGKLYHYRRTNDRVSVDAFPFITYDRETSTKTKRFSFLWRFIRYERVGKRKKLYLLFMPIKTWGEKAAPPQPATPPKARPARSQTVSVWPVAQGA